MAGGDRSRSQKGCAHSGPNPGVNADTAAAFPRDGPLNVAPRRQYCLARTRSVRVGGSHGGDARQSPTLTVEATVETDSDAWAHGDDGDAAADDPDDEYDDANVEDEGNLEDGPDDDGSDGDERELDDSDGLDDECDDSDCDADRDGEGDDGGEPNVEGERVTVDGPGDEGGDADDECNIKLDDADGAPDDAGITHGLAGDEI